MGNFEEQIPKNIATLEKELGSKRRAIWAIQAKYQHDCNCEYCTEDEVNIPEEAQNEIDNIEAKIDDILLTINRLKRHATVHGIELKDKKKVAA